MKKILLSAIALIALGTTAQAQGIGIGAKAGVNFANFGGDIEDASGRTGFHVGLVTEFKLSETFAIQPELVFSQQGSQTEVFVSNPAGEPFKIENKQTLNYINIPIMAKYFVTDGLSIQVGPQIGFLVSAKAVRDGENLLDDSTVERERDNKDEFESIDFGLVAGLGYELPMGVFFQARYNVGLSNVYKDSEAMDDADITVNNQVLTVSVGYKFM